ncbi:hypothetical protein D3C81_1580370 [compost metagenome]
MKVLGALIQKAASAASGWLAPEKRSGTQRQASTGEEECELGGWITFDEFYLRDRQGKNHIHRKTGTRQAFESVCTTVSRMNVKRERPRLNSI